jgi:hypothetical protein
VAAVGQYFQSGDVIGAINELINIPAYTTNAFLNGAGALDLTSVVVPLLPPNLAGLIQSIGLNLGGWLSPAVPFNGSLTAANNPPTEYTGGTLFDIVSAKTKPVAGIGGTTTGLPVGWGGSVIGLGQFLGQQLLVTPPAPGATVAAAAAALGAAAATAAISATATVPATPAIPDALVSGPAAQNDAPTPPAGHRGRSAAGSANSGNDTAGAASAGGMAKSAGARGAARR